MRSSGGIGCLLFQTSVGLTQGRNYIGTLVIAPGGPVTTSKCDGSERVVVNNFVGQIQNYDYLIVGAPLS